MPTASCSPPIRPACRTAFVVPPAPSASGATFVGSDRLDITQKVSSGGDKVSTIYLRAGMRELQQTDLGFRVDHAGGAGGLSGGVGAPGPPASAIRHRADPAAGRRHAARHQRRRLLGPRGETQQRRAGRAQRRLQHHARPDRARPQRLAAGPRRIGGPRRRSHRRTPGGQGGRRSGQPGQERLPGQHEPRNPHPHDRHSRLLRLALAARHQPQPNATSFSTPSSATATICWASSTTSSTSRRSRPAR